jgi:hypothetical protein
MALPPLSRLAKLSVKAAGDTILGILWWTLLLVSNTEM